MACCGCAWDLLVVPGLPGYTPLLIFWDMVTPSYAPLLRSQHMQGPPATVIVIIIIVIIPPQAASSSCC
eukprot:5636495-Karenia_brevis.AAC.1